MKKLVLLLAALIVISTASYSLQSKPLYRQIGLASWYGNESGKFTASGERWDPRGMTAASWELNFNKKVRITNLKSGKSVVVRINDRGPSKRLRPRRIIDLSQAAATRLGMKHSGIAKVLVEELP